MLWKCCLSLNCLVQIMYRLDNLSVNYRTGDSVLPMWNLKMNNAFVKPVTLHLATSMLNKHDIHASNLPLSMLTQQASTEHALYAKHCSKSSSRHRRVTGPPCVTWEELITTKTTTSCCVACKTPTSGVRMVTVIKPGSSQTSPCRVDKHTC